MENFVIISDVNCDLNSDLRKRFGIEYIPGHIIYPGEPEKSISPDWVGTTQKEFYTELKKNNGNGYLSSPANIDEYAAKFEEFASKGYDILSISLSSGMSGTYNFSLKGREMVLEKYPNVKIFCVDSLRYSTLLGLMAIYASQMRSEGKTIEETAAWLEENKNRFHQMGWLDDLSFIASKGRITHSKAFFGTLVGIKPLGDIDYNGMTTVLAKVKGEKAAYDTILKYITATIEHPEDQIVFVSNSNREKQARVFIEMLRETINPKEIIYSEIHESCGVNVGPGLMAAYYFGKPISEGLADEKSLMNSILNITEGN